MSYRIASSVATGRIEATIEPPERTPPRQIVLRLRHPEGKPIKRVFVNGDMICAFLSRDGGRSWEPIARKGPQHFGAAIHPRREGWIYMTLCEGAPEAGLWLSKDHGKTWAPFDALPFANIQRLTFDPADDRAMYVTTFGGSVWKVPVEPK